MIPRWFTRGRKAPIAIAWFGIRSFWGHLQHFIASAIASENIDSRDWMHADPPERLAEQVARLISTGAGETAPESGVVTTVTGGIGRDLWIDFIADTGDDSSVSEAMGRLLAAPYQLPDPENEGTFLETPRGDLLLFGGDTAYPVATAGEIHDRVIVPFNRALVDARDGRRRVLLGIPGNHDWYDGLDGFARTFRRRIGELSIEAPPDSDASPSLHKDRESRFEHAIDFVEQFVAGKVVSKRKALVFDGYVPLQHASYFVLPLAPGLDLFAVDRQLRSLDFRQRKYFAARRESAPQNRLCVLMPDPVYAHLEESPTGVAMANALELDLVRKPHLVLTGDSHHYSRRQVDASLHVIAGGGGAFLHPARIARRGFSPPQAEWPDAKASAALLRQVPWQVAVGRSGFLPHVLLVALFAPTLSVGVEYATPTGRGTIIASALVAGFLVAIVCALVGGINRKKGKPKRWQIAGLSLGIGALVGVLPVVASTLIWRILSRFGEAPGPRLYAGLILVLAAFIGTFLYGAYLALLTYLGLENTQAFTALGHPGFKHFLRVRVRRDGSAIDAWCIGLTSPLRDKEPPVLVDTFTWMPRKKQ
jgi:hypothetical protein